MPTILPNEIILRIVSYLDIASFHNLRLAGLGSTDPSLNIDLHQLFRGRVRCLQALLPYIRGPGFGQYYLSYFTHTQLHFVRRNKGNGQSNDEELIFHCCHQVCNTVNAASPLDLDCCDYLNITTEERAGLKHSCRAYFPCPTCHLLPVDVSQFEGGPGEDEQMFVWLSCPNDRHRLAHEMQCVKSLRLHFLGRAEPSWTSGVWLPSRIDEQLLARDKEKQPQPGLWELEGFSQVRTLSLDLGCVYDFPQGVLLLANLERLILSLPVRGLPEEMGVRLSKLRVLKLFGTPVVIPESVWDTLERNAQNDETNVYIESEDDDLENDGSSLLLPYLKHRTEKHSHVHVHFNE